MADLVLKHIVIHIVNKEAHQRDIVEVDMATELDNPKSEGVTNFIEKFDDARKESIRSIAYAAFLDDTPDIYRFGDVKPLKNLLQDYLRSEQSDYNFLDMSIEVCKLYVRCLKTEALSTGSHLILFDYIDESGKPLIAITLMNQEFGSFVEEHKMKKSLLLNIKHMSLAAIINVERWLNILQGTEKEKTNYISFICGLKDFANYYREGFIGCDRVSRSTKSTRDFMDAMEGFMKDVLLKEPNDWEEARNIACAHMRAHDKETVTKHLLNEMLSNPEEQDKFYKYVQDNGFEISESFKPHKTIYNRWQKLIYKEKGLRVEATQDKISTGVVTYEQGENGQPGRLIIKDVSGNLFKEYDKFS